MTNLAFFKDKVIIVTGASSGIGENLALRFSHLGAKVVLAARNKAKLTALKNHINASGKEAIAVKTDIAIEKEVINLINRTQDKWGRIDILISNAGQYIQGYMNDINSEAFRRSFEVNFYGSLYAVKHIVPIMDNQKAGHIVFINTLDAKKGIVGDGPYVVAKSALDGFADVLRQEVKDTGIKVLTVYPSRVDTPMIQHIHVSCFSPKMSVEKVVNAVVKGILKNKPLIVVPQMLYLLGALNNVFPRVMDWLYKKFRLEGEKISN